MKIFKSLLFTIVSLILITNSFAQEGADNSAYKKLESKIEEIKLNFDEEFAYIVATSVGAEDQLQEVIDLSLTDSEGNVTERTFYSKKPIKVNEKNNKSLEFTQESVENRGGILGNRTSVPVKYSVVFILDSENKIKTIQIYDWKNYVFFWQKNNKPTISVNRNEE